MAETVIREFRTCQHCGKEFKAKRRWAKFCSATCRLANWREKHPRLTPEERSQILEKLGIRDD